MLRWWWWADLLFEGDDLDSDDLELERSNRRYWPALLSKVSRMALIRVR